MKRIRIAIVLFAACAGLAALASCKGAYTGDNSFGLLPASSLIITDDNYLDLAGMIENQTKGHSVGDPVNVVVKVKNAGVFAHSFSSQWAPESDYSDPLWVLYNDVDWAGRYVTLDLSALNISDISFSTSNPNVSGTNGAEIISTDRFYGKWIVGVKIPDSLSVIGSYAFATFNNLRSVSIPGTIKTISKNAFAWTGLEGDLALPEGLFNVDIYSFYDTKISSVSFPTTTKMAAGSSDGYAIAANSFSACPNLKTVTLRGDPGVTHHIDEHEYQGGANGDYRGAWVAAAAFSGCTALTTLNVFSGVGLIHSMSFIGCTNLKTITFKNLVSPFYISLGIDNGLNNGDYNIAGALRGGGEGTYKRTTGAFVKQ
jgi:hypothetical protein